MYERLFKYFVCLVKCCTQRENASEMRNSAVEARER